jgi:hypothetical protein
VLFVYLLPAPLLVAENVTVTLDPAQTGDVTPVTEMDCAKDENPKNENKTARKA